MAEPNELNFGEKIKKRRVELGMSQQELAEKVGFKTASAINKIELGLREVKIKMIPVFAKVLNLDPCYLFDSEQKKEGVPMDKKITALIENLYTEQDTIDNLLKIFMDYIESEGLVAMNHPESEIIAATCFFNRLPMFFSLLYCVSQKVGEVKDSLESLLNERSD